MAKLSGLEEVKADAKYNYLKRLKEAEADREYELAKEQSPEKVDEVTKKVAQAVTKKGK